MKTTRIVLGTIAVIAAMTLAAYAAPPNNGDVSRVADGQVAGGFANDKCVAITVESPPSGGIYNSLPVLRIHYLDVAGGIDRGYYQIDGCTGTSWTAIWSYNCATTDTTVFLTVPAVTEGIHAVHFKATDDTGLGNVDSCSYSWMFTYDTTKPTYQVTSPVSGGGYITLPTIAIHFADDRGLNRAYYQIDGCGGTWTALWSYDCGRADTTVLWTPPAMAEGTHTIHFRVTDDAGNENNDACSGGWSLTYDYSRPTVTVNSPPPGGVYGVPPTLNIHFVDNVGISRAYYQLDGCNGVWTELWSYNAGGNDTTIAWIVPVAPEGEHDIYFKVSDDVGNQNGDICSYSWQFTYTLATVALSPSSVVDMCGQRDTLWITLSQQIMDLKAAYFRLGYDNTYITPIEVIRGPALDPPGSSVIYPYIYPDSIAVSLAILTGALNGPAVILGIVYDAAAQTASTAMTVDSSILRDSNNQDIFHAVSGSVVQIDCTRPTVVVTSPPSGGLYNVLPTVSMTFHDDIGIDRGYYQIDGCSGPWTELWSYNSGQADTGIAWTVPPVSKGTHTVYFKATDDAGNVNGDSCSSSWSFTYRTPVMSLEATRALIRCGDQDTIWIAANGDMVDVKGAYIRISYDDGYLTPLAVVGGPALQPPSNYVIYSNIYADSVVINLAALVGDFDGPGRMLGVVMQGVAEAVSTALAVGNSVLRDPSNQSIPHTTTGTSVQIDCTRPTVVVTSPPSGGLYGLSPVLNLALHDNVGLDRGYYQIDGCSGPWTELWSYNSGHADTGIVWTVPPVALGPHTIYFKTIDDVGYTNSDTCTYTWSFTYRNYMCGDANGDLVINIGDAVYIVNYVFRGGPAPNPIQSGDANCDGKINVGDAVYLVNYIFRGGPEPCCP